ncbi:amidase [Lichenifustis flavocetrariae]|uniref:Indoleacetamide hydrolase n=1 Tax=Lichenifustis flavocetrariae TaxID=2949735 RepID=A0AA41YZM3_9HYPH|nr:amidase [Lichenifustis flavocetrariae]MCW6507823.1 amidase [Lichenifustis flavocetrariae]
MDYPEGSARARLELALGRIADSSGEGARACLTVYAEVARHAAVEADDRAAANRRLSPIDGWLVTVKDLFDIAGEVTRAGSKAIAQEGRVAVRDAEVVRRVRAAGAIIVAKTNMSELAFSGVGTNLHYGTPANPLDRMRVPGGSSSGAAVAVADGFCDVAIGSDTGGSVRIPAALCGLVGFKPTQARVSRAGAFPLSKTLDAVGPLAKDVAACAAVDAVLSGEEPADLSTGTLAGLRIGVVQGFVLDGLDSAVAQVFAAALVALDRAGATLAEVALPQFEAMRTLNARAAITPAEALVVHGARFEAGAAFDPFICARLERARAIAAADLAETRATRGALMESLGRELNAFDVLVMPTVPILAPTLAEVEDAERFNDRNLLLLRNTTVANFFDLPAVSLPLTPGIGFSVMMRSGEDRRVLAVARAMEACFAASGEIHPGAKRRTKGDLS